MSRENRVGRDQRPPAARFAEVEAALDRRVLDALAAAWSMATERNLIAGQYWTREDVRELAADLAEPITEEQAAEVVERSARAAGISGVSIDADTLLDDIWEVIA